MEEQKGAILPNLRLNRLLYRYSQIAWLAMVIPSVVVIWLNAGLEFSEILLLQGLFALMLIGFEFPSGILADILQRKLILTISHAFETIAVLIYAFANYRI